MLLVTRPTYVRLSCHGIRSIANYNLDTFLTGGISNSRRAYYRTAQAVNTGRPQCVIRIAQVVVFNESKEK